MKKIILINKKEGETPLEALENFRIKNKEYQNSKITYAGRLDPMASGLLLLLIDEKIKEKEKYLALNKEYAFEVLFGFKTDTYDILGKIEQKNFKDLNKKDLEKLIKIEVKNFLGAQKQKYPIYSSKTVQGQPLFTYARKNQKVKIPIREIFIQSLVLKKIRKIDNQKLYKNIEKRIQKVQGDFRQKEILKLWQKNLKKDNYFYLASFLIKSSSGTYVRSVANLLGEKLKIPALAFKIKRKKIGKFILFNNKF